LNRLVASLIVCITAAATVGVSPAHARSVPPHRCAVAHECPPVFLMGHLVTAHRTPHTRHQVYVEWSGATFGVAHAWRVSCARPRDLAVLDAWRGKRHRHLWTYVYACGTTWKEALT